MQFSSRPTTHNRVVHLRLAGIKLDLGISGEQDSAWELFVKTFKTVARALKDVEDEVALHFIEGPPSFAKNLELEVRSLSARVEAISNIERYRRMLQTDLEQTTRSTVQKLLGEFEAKLSSASTPSPQPENSTQIKA